MKKLTIVLAALATIAVAAPTIANAEGLFGLHVGGERDHGNRDRGEMHRDGGRDRGGMRGEVHRDGDRNRGGMRSEMGGDRRRYGDSAR